MRTLRIRQVLASLGLAGVAAMASSGAWAAPVPAWDYTVSSVFSLTAGDTTFTAGAGCQGVGAGLISWGDCPTAAPGPGRSGIGITASPQVGVIATNGVAKPANTYTHTNNVVSGANATLKKATINATLGLKIAGSAGPFTFFSATYNVLFAETPNATPCTAPSPINNPCNDIWVLSGSLNNDFMFGGDQYFFSFYASPSLTPLSGLECAAVGAGPGCIGFTTVEGQPNQVNFLMALTSEPISVPEPSSLALLGISLLAFAGLRQRKS